MPNKNYIGEELPESPQSYWIDSVNLPGFPRLDKDIEVDIAIVGGGITGLTSAFLLVNEGFKVALLDAGKLMNGTTGHTTAKVTAQHDLIYNEFIRNIGKDKARLYYDANIEALNFIENTIKQHRINCDFNKQDAYIYALTEETASKVEKEAEAYVQIGIDGELVNNIPLGIKVKNGLVMKNQAQFHPAKYLAHLVKVITEKGGQIFENTTAVNMGAGDHPTVLTRDKYRVGAKYVLICSHFPFYEGKGPFSAKMHASRSYILATRIKGDFPGGMYISADKPAHSLRSVKINGEEMVLIVGEDHRAGKVTDTLQHYKALGEFGRSVFDLEDIVYRWSAQDLITPDKIPYIGQLTNQEPNILVATGYRKWGITNGTAAALLFRDMVRGKKSRYKDLYSPSRLTEHPGLEKRVAQNANAAGQLPKGNPGIPSKMLEDLSNDEAAMITVQGQKRGAYKDKEGSVHIVNTTCSHRGCEVRWNNGDRTWDCPCHGSRFSYTGEVIEGPAEVPLKKILS